MNQSLLSNIPFGTLELLAITFLEFTFILLLVVFMTISKEPKVSFEIRSLEKDGQPGPEDLGKTAFVYEGRIVSGFYLPNGKWMNNINANKSDTTKGVVTDKYIVFSKRIRDL